MSEYDRQKDIAAEGQRAALYHGDAHTKYVHDMITKSPEQAIIDALVAALEPFDAVGPSPESDVPDDHLCLVEAGWLRAASAALALARGGK